MSSPAAPTPGHVSPGAAAGGLPPAAVVLDVGVAGQTLVLLPATGVQQHAVTVVLVHGLHLLVAPLADGLLHLGRPGLDQQVQRGRDEGEADVLDHLGLVRGDGDGPLLEVNLQCQVEPGDWRGLVRTFTLLM